MANQLDDNVHYIRENGEIDFKDTIAINNSRDEQNRDIIDNGRLGSYNATGEYVISHEIVDELIRMPKKLVSTTLYDKYREGSDVYDLRTTIPQFGEIEFKLVVSKTTATLYLVENVFREAGGYLEVYEQPISQLDLSGSDMNIQSIFGAFRITKEEDADDTDLGKMWAEGDFDNVLIRKIYLSQLSYTLLNSVSVGEREAFEEITNLLKNSGEYGKKVLKAFVERLEDRPEILKIKDTAGYNRALNDALISVIDIVTTDKDKTDEKTKVVYDKITTIRNEKFNKVLPVAKELVTIAVIKEIHDQIKGKAKTGDLTTEFKTKFEQAKNAVDKNKMQNLGKPVLKAGVQTPAAVLKARPLTERERVEEVLTKAKERAASQDKPMANKPPQKYNNKPNNPPPKKDNAKPAPKKDGKKEDKKADKKIGGDGYYVVVDKKTGERTVVFGDPNKAELNKNQTIFVPKAEESVKGAPPVLGNLKGSQPTEAPKVTEAEIAAAAAAMLANTQEAQNRQAPAPQINANKQENLANVGGTSAKPQKIEQNKQEPEIKPAQDLNQQNIDKIFVDGKGDDYNKTDIPTQEGKGQGTVDNMPLVGDEVENRTPELAEDLEDSIGETILLSGGTESLGQVEQEVESSQFLGQVEQEVENSQLLGQNPSTEQSAINQYISQSISTPVENLDQGMEQR